jgi:hypothetical protein
MTVRIPSYSLLIGCCVENIEMEGEAGIYLHEMPTKWLGRSLNIGRAT